MPSSRLSCRGIFALAWVPALLACAKAAPATAKNTSGEPTGASTNSFLEPKANASAKSAGTSSGSSLTIRVEREVFGVETITLSGPVLFKRLPREGFVIAFFNTGSKNADCNVLGLDPDIQSRQWHIAGPIGGDAFAFLLTLDGEAFWNNVDSRRYTMWRLYYSKPGSGKSTYEAAGPSTSNVHVKLTAVNAERAQGSVSGTLTLSPRVGTTVQGSFDAKLCD